MPVLPGFITHCSELLAGAGEVRTKRMFGGVGAYVDDLFIAILVGDVLYLKTDDETRAAFEQAGGAPFEFDMSDKTQVTSYWSVPADAMDSAARMRPWAQLARDAAVRVQAKKKPKKPRR